MQHVPFRYRGVRVPGWGYRRGRPSSRTAEELAHTVTALTGTTYCAVGERYPGTGVGRFLVPADLARHPAPGSFAWLGAVWGGLSIRWAGATLIQEVPGRGEFGSLTVDGDEIAAWCRWAGDHADVPGVQVPKLRRLVPPELAPFLTMRRTGGTVGQRLTALARDHRIGGVRGQRGDARMCSNSVVGAWGRVDVFGRIVVHLGAETWREPAPMSLSAADIAALRRSVSSGSVTDCWPVLAEMTLLDPAAL